MQRSIKHRDILSDLICEPINRADVLGQAKDAQYCVLTLDTKSLEQTLHNGTINPLSHMLQLSVERIRDAR